MGQDSANSNDKPSTTLPGTVEKIIKPIDPREPEKAQIAVRANPKCELVLMEKHGLQREDRGE